MEREISQSSTVDPKRREKSRSAGEMSLMEKCKPKVKEVNSWDCSSTPTGNEKNSKKKISNWDSSSECQETMVEPFDSNNDNPKDNDDWDSESEKNSVKIIASTEKGKTVFSSGSISLGFSIDDLSDIEKSSLIFESEKGIEEELLLIEDLEEFPKNVTPKMTQSEKSGELGNFLVSDNATKSEKVRSNRSGTPEDTTVWMIPKSDRTQSADSTSRLLSGSGREKFEKLHIIKKSKSISNVQKTNNKRRSSRTTRSDCLGSDKNLLQCEALSLQKKLKNLKEGISGCEGFDRTRVFFTEYECRTMTMQKDMSDKASKSSRSNTNGTEEMASEQIANENAVLSLDENRDSATSSRAYNRPGTSMDMDVLSMPDIYGRKSTKQRGKETQGTAPVGSGQVESTSRMNSGVEICSQTESWFLLENTGQYLEITRNEVSILMNGRSADAVLQGRKEHLIPQIKVTDRELLRQSLSSLLTKESLQYFLKQEDMGGEGSSRKLELERKIENTLLYIQPGMNQTASIRIIPVEREMIHIWRAARDTESRLSSEADILLSSQESIGTAAEDLECRVSTEQNLAERNETQTAQNKPSNAFFFTISNPLDCSKLLFETREIVDNLANNFKTLQTRLDGETHKRLILQNEINKMKAMLKNSGNKIGEINSRDLIFDQPVKSSSSLLTIKAADKAEMRSESIMEEDVPEDFSAPASVWSDDNGTQLITRKSPQKIFNQVSREQNTISVQDNNIITVNIYTVDDNCIGIVPIPVSAHESNSLIQSNLNLVEERLKRLQAENESITNQNGELKKKLKEISLELEKYLSESPEQELHADEGRDVESLRDQVCNLKLELENLKNLAGSEKKNLLEENFLIREECKKSLLLLNEWVSTAAEISKNIKTVKNKLRETGIDFSERVEPETVLDPKTFSDLINTYVRQSIHNLLIIKNENSLYEQTLKKNICDRVSASQDTFTIHRAISDYDEIVEQNKKGQTTRDTENKVMEDYFTIIMEKATLMEEIKILKTENEMLIENQEQNYEKLKQTMIALKDQKSEIVALESSQKLSEEEKGKMAEVLKLNKKEVENLKEEISIRDKTIEEIMEQVKKKDREIDDRNERLKAAVKEISNLERSCRLKDELISELKTENDELSAEEGIKDDQIRILKDEIKRLEIQTGELESELASSKVFLNQSKKEMTEYITHLETVVNNTQESLDKIKQKLKESNQTISRLKNDNEVLDKQYQFDMKLFNQTKGELDSIREKFLETEKKAEEAELQRDQILQKVETLTKTEREKTEALEILSKEYKALTEESINLKKKLTLLSKDKDETLKEQKDLINKYAMLSKEVQRLQDKYKSVKAECNERTDLIRYLEMILKENLIEYSNRIGCLEANITRLVEKIAACKSGMREKYSGGEAEVKELRHQLKVTYQERKELENIVNNYYSLMKHLEWEIQEREERVDELHVKLSLEQQKAENHENAGKFSQNIPDTKKSLKNSIIEKLQNEIAIAQNELADSRKELQHCQTNYENEKKKMELTITDLKSEINRYQLRLEVMMRNLSNSNKALNSLNVEKRNDFRNELEEKDKKIAELTALINKQSLEISAKDADLDNFKKKTSCMEEELKSSQNQIAKLQDTLSAKNKASDLQQRERDELAEKLLQSIKLIMEEKSARQAIETLAAEKEKTLKNQIDQVQNELALKTKECEALSDAMEDKKNTISKLQNDLKRIKQELNSYKKRASHKGNEDEHYDEFKTGTILRSPNVLPERLKKCLRDLKEARDLNLQLRKAEGQYQAKIVALENEIRDSRLLIKELQGDIKTEKKSKKALKNMIVAAKMQIEKCLLAKQLMSVVADKISRHLDLAEIPSRELLSGFRLSDS